MARYTYDRLSAQDNGFLIFETPSTHMHVSSILVFEAEPLRTEDGGIDIDRIRRGFEGVLHRIPRYRQKLHWIPFFDHAAWVDDRHFSLDYHIRHTALPRPGSDEQLKQLAARVMQQPLDRRRPLWETWVVEGLSGDRFALITKIHHCMIDGSSGVDIAQIQMSPSPEAKIERVPRYVPRPAPRRTELFVDEIQRTLSTPLEILRGARSFARETEDLRFEVGRRARALADMAGWASEPSSGTPINGPIGPHRRFDFLDTPLEDVKLIRRALKCSVNDVVLTVVTGAVREFMILRGLNPRDLTFRIQAPVSVRKEEEQGQLGNRVSAWTVPLPIQESDPHAQLRAIHEHTQELKENDSALGVEMMMRVAEWTPSILLSLGSRAIAVPEGAVNSIVTNVPGPQFPLYMQGAKLLALYPQVPLLADMGLGIALMSYDGSIGWGFNADPELVPDLDTFVSEISASLERVAQAAGVELSTSERSRGNGRGGSRKRRPSSRSQEKLPAGSSDAPSAETPISARPATD